jgi:hypothetical protein
MWESENQDESPLMTTDNFHGIDRLVRPAAENGLHKEWLAQGKYYMRIGTAHPRHAHRGWITSHQNAGWRYGSWD